VHFDEVVFGYYSEILFRFQQVLIEAKKECISGLQSNSLSIALLLIGDIL
jgi:hypothetical protein